MEFKLPPLLRNQQGQIRKAGFELEFGNLELDVVAHLITKLFGGRVEAEHKYSQKVVGTEIGDFSLNLDLRLLSEKGYQQVFDKLGIPVDTIQFGQKTLESIIEGILESTVKVSIPYEISIPPLAFTELAKAERLRLALHEHQAKGTRSSFLFAFAMHINPELPQLDAPTILAYTRAFLLLYPWLVKVSDIDFTRKNLTTFISPFPKDYFQLVLQSDYAPNLEQFVADYHQYNSDRNRPLDLYPLLAWVRPEQVKQFENLGKVSARPTLHYRLPNSLIDETNWSLATEWNRWYEVERLASQPATIAEFSQDYLRMGALGLVGFENVWINKMEEWVDEQTAQA